jgi:hypothetical protein
MLLTGLSEVIAFSWAGWVKIAVNMTRRVLKIFLIFTLLTGQPAMAGHLKVHHGGCEYVTAAAMTADMHHDREQAAARSDSHMPDYSNEDIHCASCGACCAALASRYSFIAPLIPSPRPEPAQLLFAQPDLAAAIDPPRS